MSKQQSYPSTGNGSLKIEGYSLRDLWPLFAGLLFLMAVASALSLAFSRLESFSQQNLKMALKENLAGMEDHLGNWFMLRQQDGLRFVARRDINQAFSICLRGQACSSATTLLNEFNHSLKAYPGTPRPLGIALIQDAVTIARLGESLPPMKTPLWNAALKKIQQGDNQAWVLMPGGISWLLTRSHPDAPHNLLALGYDLSRLSSLTPIRKAEGSTGGLVRASNLEEVFHSELAEKIKKSPSGFTTLPSESDKDSQFLTAWQELKQGDLFLHTTIDAAEIISARNATMNMLAVLAMSLSGIFLFILALAVKSRRKDRRLATELSRAAYTLSREKNTLGQITSTLPSALVTLDAQGTITYANPGALKLFNLATTDLSRRLYGKDHLNLRQAGGHELANAEHPFNKVRTSGREQRNQQYLLLEPDGSVRILLTNAAPLIGPNGGFQGVVFISTDITRQHQDQIELGRRESLLSAMAESLPGMLAVLDAQGGIISSNRAWRLWQGSHDPAQALTCSELVGGACFVNGDDGENEKLANELQEGINCVLHGDCRDFEQEYQGISPDGKPSWYQLHITTLDRAEGGAVAIQMDITSRKSSELARLESQAKYRSLVETLPAAVIIYQNNAIVFVNSTGIKLMSASSEKDILGKSPSELTAHHERARIEEYVAMRREDHNSLPSAYEVEVVSFKGHSFPAEIRVSPVIYNGAPAFQAIITDITERKSYERELAASESQLREIFNTVRDAFIIFGSDDLLISRINDMACEMFGYTEAEFIGMKVKDLGLESTLSGKKTQKDFLDLAREHGAHTTEWLGRKADGSRFWGEVTMSIRHESGREMALLVVRDIQARKEAEEQIQLAAKVFENTIEGITITDPDGVIQMVNPAFSEITGYSAEEVLGKKPSVLRSERHDDGFYRKMWGSLRERGLWSGEIWNRRKNGEAYPEWLTITAIRDGIGNTTHYVAVFHDITETKRHEQEIKHQAYHDALTGLPNRLLFNDRLRQATNRAQRSGDSVAVVFLDLDLFKNINDTMGHAAGDRLLQEVGKRLQGIMRKGDTICRQGGDEFLIVLPDMKMPDYAVNTADRIIKAMRKPFIIDGDNIFIGCSIGITYYPDDGHDPETLIKNADMAMYQAKEMGRNNYKIFTSDLQERIVSRITLEQELREAIKDGELEVYYQPKVDVISRHIIGAEALVRWNKSGRVVGPDVFIPLAEETGLILPLGRLVAIEACRQAKRWSDAGFEGLSVAVNLSARQFSQNDLSEDIIHAVNTSGLNPSLLELELTESTVMQTSGPAVKSLHRLHGMGIKISLDDFGTGYSSLSNLKQLPLDALKIDRSFVSEINQNKDDLAIASAVVSMANSLGLKVVAEGVETESQLDLLRHLGCDLGQGYLFSKPVPADQFMELLRRNIKL